MKLKQFMFMGALAGASLISVAQQNSNIYSYDAGAAQNVGSELSSRRNGNSGWLQRFPFNSNLFPGARVGQEIPQVTPPAQTGQQSQTQQPTQGGQSTQPVQPYNVPGGDNTGNDNFGIQY